MRAKKSATGALVYGLEAHNVTVFDVGSVADSSASDDDDTAAPEASIVRCAVCSHRFAVPPADLDSWVGSPCLRFRCPGTFARAAVELASTYRRMYRSGLTRRVVAAEHTGQLSRTDRERVEQAFKNGGGPDAPNVLTCTPTLEMGIDIGDLSAVMLTSVPRGGAASYVQRVGRAGRKTGNALVAAFAGSDPASLYFLEDPLRMIDGEIRPPACHLDSVEIMRRQFLAYVLDAMAAHAIDAPSMPRDVVEVLGKPALSVPATNWLSVACTAAQLDPGMVERFLALFGAHISDDVADSLRDFASNGLAVAIKTAADRWQAELQGLTNRRDLLTKRIKDLDAQTVRETDEEEDLRALRGERAVIGSRITTHRREYSLSALERVGLLPSYTLTDESVELDALLWSVDDDGERTPHQTTFSRPALYAIREFAPGNTYYAQGHRFVIDALDIGTSSEPTFETWRLCPECGFGDPEAGRVWTTCPRCASPLIADLGASHKLLRVQRVLCIDSEEKARVFDETDERDRESFDEVISVDIDTVNVDRAFSLRNATFGVELARGARIRVLNLGPVDRPGAPTRIAGKNFSASKFTTCASCGVVQGARPLASGSEIRHLGWCRDRKKEAFTWETLALTHELVTDAIRMLVPVASVEATDRLATFKAVFRLGLRLSFGGDPDHLQVITSDMPASQNATPVAGGGSRRNFVVLFDTIPGGTGYLDRLADPDRLRAILLSARELISVCACAEEGLQACHRCLLGVADRREIPYVTRVLALEQIDELLRDWDPEPVATVASLGIEQLEESELERLFRTALVAWDRTNDDVMIAEAPGGRKYGYELRIEKSALQTETIRWRIREQVDISALGTSCRPDFVFTRVDGQPLEIAVFTDGERFHASPENNRLADDATKRQALLGSGRLVWNLTWNDVHEFVESVSGSTMRTPPPNRLLDRNQAELLGAPLTALRCTLPPRVATANMLDQLLTFLRSPEVEQWELLAAATVSARVSASVTSHPKDSVGQIVDDAIVGRPSFALSLAPAPPDGVVVGVVVGRFDATTAILDLAGTGAAVQRWTLLNVMPDDDLGSAERIAFWRSWLAWSNIGQFLRTNDRQFLMTTTSMASAIDRQGLWLTAGTTAQTVELMGSAKLDLDAHDLALVDPDVRELLLAALTHGLTVEPTYGLETDDPTNQGWPLEAAWPNQKVGIVTDIDEARDRWLVADGWDVRITAEWAPESLVAVTSDGAER